jgi:hypothetical protein
MQKYYLHIFIGISLIVVVFALVGAYQFKNSKDYGYVPPDTTTLVPPPGNLVGDEIELPTTDDEGSRIADPGAPTIPPVTGGKLKADVFSGKLEEVNTGCFADGECYVVVDGKHVTAIMGRSQEVVGKILGLEGFGDLEKYIGKNVEVYAQVNPDNTYTLYGSEGFYVKLSDGKSPTPTPAPTKPVAGAGCVIGGCSSQLCVDAGKGDVATTCEWTEAYACYQTAQCEKQATGQCGWTETKELNQCLLDAKSASVIPAQ